jgi:hypothetical protein
VVGCGLMNSKEEHIKINGNLFSGNQPLIGENNESKFIKKINKS